MRWRQRDSSWHGVISTTTSNTTRSRNSSYHDFSTFNHSRPNFPTATLSPQHRRSSRAGYSIRGARPIPPFFPTQSPPIKITNYFATPPNELAGRQPAALHRHPNKICPSGTDSVPWLPAPGKLNCFPTNQRQSGGLPCRPKPNG